MPTGLTLPVMLSFGCLTLCFIWVLPIPYESAIASYQTAGDTHSTFTNNDLRDSLRGKTCSNLHPDLLKAIAAEAETSEETSGLTMNTQPNATQDTAAAQVTTGMASCPHICIDIPEVLNTASRSIWQANIPPHVRETRSNTARSAFTPTVSALRWCPPAATCEKASQKCCMRPYGRHILPYVLYPTYSPTYSLTYYTLRAPIRTIAYVLPYVLTLRAPLRTPSRTIAIYRTGKSFKSTIRNSRMPACTRTPTNLIPAPDIAQYAASPKPPAVYVSRPHSHIYLAP